VSSYRQKMHAQKTFETFSHFLKREEDISRFLLRWAEVGELITKWFHRSLLKGGDIDEDVFEELKLKIAVESNEGDVNPSIGGNLLYFKVAANARNIDLMNYRQLGTLAMAEPSFRAAFRISEDAAERARAAHQYNAVLIERLGDVPMKSWATAQDLPDISRLEADIDLIAQHTAPEHVEFLRSLATEGRGWFTVD